MTGKWLADSLIEALSSVPGSPEREHVAALLRRASRIRLDGQVAEAAGATVRLAPGSIEQNLDRVTLFDNASLWLEYPHQNRLSAFAGQSRVPVPTEQQPREVGCLLACNPGHETHVAVFVAWRLADGRILHSYAILHWDVAALHRAGDAARARPPAGAPTERLMALARASMPPGMASEMQIWQDISPNDRERQEEAVLLSMRQALGEHLFLLAALLLLDSSSVELQPLASEAPQPEQGDEEADIAPPRWDAHMVPAARRWPWRSPPPGFSAGWSGPLRWSRPAEED